MTEETKNELMLANTQVEGGLVVAADFGDDETLGYEGETAEDFSIPFIQLLQDNSPAVKKKSDKYIDGAEPGYFLNTVTNELYNGDQGFLFQICFVEHCVIEWWPHGSDQGKGFVAKHDVNSKYVLECQRKAGKKYGKIPTDKGTELQETYSLWGIIPKGDNEMPDFAIVSISSEKIKPYKNFNLSLGKFMLYNPRTKRKQKVHKFAHLIRITSKFVNKNDYDFFTVIFEPANIVGTMNENLAASIQPPETINYQAAKKFHDLIVSGDVAADFDSVESDVQGEEDDLF